MITKVEVEGYRLLHEFEADLGELTVAIGANATGKSTLQDFLRFVCQAAERPINAPMKERGGFPTVLSAGVDVQRIGWRITFTKPARNPIWAWLPIDPDKEVVHEALMSGGPPYYAALPEYEALRYAQPHGEHPSPFKFLEYRDGVSRVYDFETRRLVDLNEVLEERDLFSALEERGEGDLPKAPKGESLKDLFDVAAEGPSLLLAQVRFPQRFPQASYLRLFFASWAFYPGFRVDEYSPVRTGLSDVEPVTSLGPMGENLATVLHEILTKHEYRSAAESLRDWLRSAYPNFEQISAETVPGTRGKVAIRWHERGMRRGLNASDLSDGLLRFLCLAAVLNNPRPAPLVAIDEPEVGLHPKLLPIVADMLKSAAEQTQVLVTTHSPDLLDRFDLDDVAVMVREENHVRWHRPSSRPTLKTLLESVEGESLGDLHRTGELEAGV